MLEAICSGCKAHYHGRALDILRNQSCVKCGNPLEIRNAGTLLYGPSLASKTEEYRCSTEEDEWENLCTMNLLIYLSLN
jgi:hypothetical protein